MSTSNWIGSSGDWSNAADWSAGVPVAGDTAYFSASTIFAVTFSTGLANLAGVGGYDSQETILLSGGELTSNAWYWEGAYNQTGGTLNITGVSPSWTGGAVSISGGVLALGDGALFYNGLAQSGGTIQIAAGTLSAAGTTTVLGGTLSGEGALGLGVGAAATLAAGAALDVAHIALGYSSTLALISGTTYQGDLSVASTGTIQANGQSLVLGTLGAGDFAGYFAGGGTLEVQGAYDLGGLELSGTNDVAFIDNTVIQDSSPIILGVAATDNDTLVIRQGGIFANTESGNITGNSLSALVDLGIYAATNPVLSGAAVVSVESFTLASGAALEIAGSAVVDLQGASSKASALLLGSVGGAGTLQIGGNETASLGGISLDVAHLYMGSYYAQPGEMLLTAGQDYEGTLVTSDGTIDTNGFVFTLGSASRGTLSNIISGGGTLLLAGDLALSGPSLTGAGTELQISGTAYAAPALVNLAAGTTFAVANGGTLDFANGNGIYASGAALVENAGLIELTDSPPGNGPLISNATFVNTGTLALNDGILQLFAGTATLGGVVEGLGVLELNSDTVTLVSGLQMNVAGLDFLAAHITLAGNVSLGSTLLGGTASINTEGHNLTLVTGAVDAVFSGGGTVVVQGPLTAGAAGISLYGQGTTLLDQYSVVEDGSALSFGNAVTDSPTLAVAAGAGYTLESTSGISSYNGTTGVLLNQGQFIDADLYPLGPLTQIVLGTFINQGTLDDAIGSLALHTSLVNDGLITIAQNVQILGNVTADAGDIGTFAIGTGATLGFSGAFLTNPQPASLVSASQIVTFAGADGVLQLGAPQSFSGTIEGFAAGDIINVSAYVPSPGGPNAFYYANNELTLSNVSETGVNPLVLTTVALETLALVGINPADLQIFSDNTGLGGYDIELSNSPTGDAPAYSNYPQVYGATWLGPSSADWGTAADWATAYSLAGALTNPQIENVVPPAGYNISLVNGLTLTYGTASTGGLYVANTLYTTQGSTLDITGGTLAAEYGMYASGVVNITGGTLEQLSGFEVPASIGTIDLAAGGALRVDDGSLVLGVTNLTATSNILAGTLEGAGQIVLAQTGYLVDSSAVLGAATLTGNDARVTLTGSNEFTGEVMSLQGGDFNLNGNNFLITAGSTLLLQGETINGGGTLTVAGQAELGGLITGNNTELLITGTAQMGYSPLSLGTLIASGAVNSEIVVAASGVFYNPSFIESVGPWSGTLINNGLVEQTTTIIPYDEVGQQEQLGLFVNNTGGVLDVAAGVMDFDLGSAILAGQIVGRGVLEFSSETVSLQAGLQLGGAELLFSGVVLALDANESYTGNFQFNGGTIETNGDTLALGTSSFYSTGALLGTVAGGGALVLGGTYYASALELGGTGTRLDEYGLLNLGGGLQDGFGNGDIPTIAIEAGGTINFQAPVDTNYGQGVLINAGLLEDSAVGNVLWSVGSFAGGGSIEVKYGELGILANYGTVDGLVTGGGTLQLQSLNTLTLGAGLNLEIGTFALQSGLFDIAAPLTYAGIFLSSTNTTFNLSGGGLDLTGGGTLGGTLTGLGGITIAGDILASTIYMWSPGTTLDVTGTLVEGLSGFNAGSSNTVGAGAQLLIGSTGVVDLAADQYFGAAGSFDNFTILNAGLIEKTGFTGTSTIAASSFLNTGTIAALDGSIDITGVLVNDGVLFEDAFGAISAASITGTGVIIIDPAATTISGAVGAGQSVSFAGPGGTLVLQDAAQFAGTITGFGASDLIDISTLASSSVTGVSFVNGALTITETSGSLTLDIAGVNAGTAFTYSTDGVSGTYIEENALCFCAGTRILTPAGEVPVDKLRAGDEVITRFGGVQTIKWIGRQNYAACFIRRNPAKIPVRIAPGALGGGLPRRELAMSPGHSVLLRDTLLLGFTLVNGVTITQPVPVAEVAYYQLDLLTHDCVMAEGVWAETFADAPGLRAQFHNAVEFAALVPDYETPEGLTLCAPRPQDGRELAAALRPVVAQAAALVTPGVVQGYLDQVSPGLICGWARDIANPDLPVLLDILCHGTRIGQVLACDARDDLAALGYGRRAFSFVPDLPLTPDALCGITLRACAQGAILPRVLAVAA